MKLAESMSRIGVESAFDVLVRARALEAKGKSVIHLEIGEPDFNTPAHIIEAAKKALDEGWTHYGPTQGLPELRQVIADSTTRTHGVKVGPESVCVVPGGKPIIFFPILALVLMIYLFRIFPNEILGIIRGINQLNGPAAFITISR